jgi:hypothetical protein
MAGRETGQPEFRPIATEGERTIPVVVVWDGQGEPYPVQLYRHPKDDPASAELVAEILPEEPGRAYPASLTITSNQSLTMCERSRPGCEFARPGGGETGEDGYPCCYEIGGGGAPPRDVPPHVMVWSGFPMAGAGGASPHTGMAAVARSADLMEVWWVGQDGSVQDRWYDGANWQGFQMAGPGSASLSSGIAAVARSADLMEVWWVGQDGSVRSDVAAGQSAAKATAPGPYLPDVESVCSHPGRLFVHTMQPSRHPYR